MKQKFSRRQFLATGAGLYVATNLTSRQIWAAVQDKEPKKLIHCLSNETYSFRKLYGEAKLSHHTVAEFHQNLNIRGVSLNDLYFKSWDKDYLEKILETYYDVAVWKTIHVALDYQFITDPAFNRDRGPVSVIGARLHWEF